MTTDAKISSPENLGRRLRSETYTRAENTIINAIESLCKAARGAIQKALADLANLTGYSVATVFRTVHKAMRDGILTIEHMTIDQTSSPMNAPNRYVMTKFTAAGIQRYAQAFEKLKAWRARRAAKKKASKAARPIVKKAETDSLIKDLQQDFTQAERDYLTQKLAQGELLWSRSPFAKR